jgi:hypothetical protein
VDEGCLWAVRDMACRLPVLLLLLLLLAAVAMVAPVTAH